MKELENITCFRTVTACIMSDLYALFPGRIDLDVFSYQQELIEDKRLSAHCLKHKSEHLNLIALTIDYLLDEGYLTHQELSLTMEARIHMGLRLTEKGFTALEKPFNPMEKYDKSTIGKTIYDLTQKGSGIATAQSIKETISLLFS